MGGEGHTVNAGRLAYDRMMDALYRAWESRGNQEVTVAAMSLADEARIEAYLTDEWSEYPRVVVGNLFGTPVKMIETQMGKVLVFVARYFPRGTVVVFSASAREAWAWIEGIRVQNAPHLYTASGEAAV